MKKFISILISVTMMLGLLSVTLVSASGSDISVVLDGRKIEFDVQPQIINDRTMVPMRAIFEKLGALVEWNQDTQTVTASKDFKKISFTVMTN